MTVTKSVVPTDELKDLCTQHLREEEALLAAALPMVRAVKEGFHLPHFAAFIPTLAGHREFAKRLEEIGVGRQRFREALARHLGLPARDITLARGLASLPAADQVALAGAADRVRRLAHELAATNHTVSVHLRIHLEAYRRILRDLTNTSAGSGRYGRAGKTETLDYRPLLLIHG